MNGLQELIVNELYDIIKSNFNIVVSYFQIYGGKCLDLLNQKTVLSILEDKNGSIQIPGLTEKDAANVKELLSIMEEANSNRTTHATTSNDTSSRSHAICQVRLPLFSYISGKMEATNKQGNQYQSTQLEVKGLKILKATTVSAECKGLR